MSLSYKEVIGDVFSSPWSSALAHCISLDCKQSKGIALEFCRRFGRNHFMEKKNLHVGDIIIQTYRGRPIFNLITKKRFFNKPTYESLESALIAMRNYLIQHNILGVSLPKLGCGIDRLKWKHVKLLIQRVFNHTNIEVTVYILNKEVSTITTNIIYHSNDS